MHYVLARIADNQNVYVKAKQIDVIQATEWITSAWKEVSKDTIKSCFAKCGVVEQPASIETTKMSMKNLTISLKNYLRSCKSMVTSLLANTLSLITRFSHHSHLKLLMSLTGFVFPWLPAFRNMVLLTTLQSKLKATTALTRTRSMKEMYLRLAPEKMWVCLIG